MRNRATLCITAIIIAALFVSCGKPPPSQPGNGTNERDPDKKPDIAFVSNGVASFWTIAKAGCIHGANKYYANVDVRMPVDGVGDQKRIIQDLLTRGIEGIAISPIDAVNQAEDLKKVAEQTHFITQDSDAPDSGRLCYVGMDNYKAGRLCGKLVKEAIPDGGEIVIFIGRLEQDNARRRRQGVIDELLDRSEDSSRFDPAGEVPKDGKYKILDTRTDGFDRSKAKANAQDIINVYPNLACMVGLFAYNPPLMLEAVKESGEKASNIKIVAFDEADATLQAIIDGTMHGTVVQNPFEYGVQSVRILAGLARGDKSVLPEGGFLDIPAQQIRKDNVQEFWDTLKANLAKAGE
ncbi:MAG: ribose transport system substrate-binding protein [Rhodothermales bacterium]|jgi:ribose transport system substrate-binding protein